MKTYRVNVFETNSSSSHSLILSNKTLEDQYRCQTLAPDENGIIRLEGGEFGWEWERFTTAYWKANYLMVYALMYERFGDDSIKEMLIDVIIEETGAKAVDILADVNHWDSEFSSYIDHQSYDDIRLKYGDVITNKDVMRSFIFDVRSILVTGNDNSYAPCGIYDEPGTKYKYKLSFPSLIPYSDIYTELGLEWYFKECPSNDELVQITNEILSVTSYDGDGTPYPDHEWDGNYSSVSEHFVKRRGASVIDTLLSNCILYKTSAKDGSYHVDIDDMIYIPYLLEEGEYELHK